MPERFRATQQASRKAVAYARRSSHDQQEALGRQKQVLELYCTRQERTFEVIADLGSGMNCRKKGLNRLLGAIIDDQAGRLAAAHKDRLLRLVVADRSFPSSKTCSLRRFGQGRTGAVAADLHMRRLRRLRG